MVGAIHRVAVPGLHHESGVHTELSSQGDAVMILTRQLRDGLTRMDAYICTLKGSTDGVAAAKGRGNVCVNMTKPL